MTRRSNATADRHGHLCLVDGMTSGSSRTELAIEPLTPSLWPAFADLLDQGGPAGRCWCVAPMGIDYRRRPADKSRDDFRDVVKKGPPPGLIALSDQLAVGWCRVTPHESGSVRTDTAARPHSS